MKLVLRCALMVLLLAAALSASTAYACGCGIYIPREGEAEVAKERALVRWDGQREDIVLSLGVLGSSQEAAIILPVPAQAEVRLADTDLFDELDEMTKPLVREQVEWVFGLGNGEGALAPGAVGGAPSVIVLSRQKVGPFDVANLSATDTNALKEWLDENGFRLDPRIPTVLAPYVEQGWTFVAVRLQPDQASSGLSGDLTPLQISFGSSELVYPMRASALADNSQALDLYVLADHRVDKELAFGTSRVAYADWVEPAALAAGSTLASLVPRRSFLTKFVDTINPAKVHDDFIFRFAPQDTPYREVEIVRVQRDATPFVLLGCALLLGMATLAVVVLVAFLARRGRTAAGTAG